MSYNVCSDERLANNGRVRGETSSACSQLHRCRSLRISPLPQGCSARDDSCSSGTSVIRVPLEEDAASEAASECSSAASVIRLPLDAGEESDCSSDGSVIRVPVGAKALGEKPVDEEAGSGGGWNRETPSSSPEASGPKLEGVMSRQSSSVRFASHQPSSSPSNARKNNLQAAAKYFAPRGARDGTAAKNAGKIAGGAGSPTGLIMTTGANGGGAQVWLLPSRIHGTTLTNINQP